MSSGRSWNHRVYRLDPADVDRNDRFGASCATGKCTALPTHATRWDYITGGAGRVSDTERLVCTAHAEAFARKHDLTIGEPPPRPPQPGLLEAPAGPGTAISVRLHCVRGRQWYLQQHQMPSSHALHFLRDRLVSTGVLAERPEYLDRIPAWVDQLTGGRPDGHSRLIRTYAQWDALRRARRRPGPRATAGQAQKVRSKIRVASAFLDWLASHGRDLATAGQADLDLWLVITHRPDLARDLSPFLSWARQRRLCGPLTVPHRPRAEPLPGLAGDQRWQHLRTCLTDSATLPLAARSAAAIALLYGAPLTHVLSMRTTDILTISGRSHLRLGEHPVLLPPALAGLIRRQAAEAGSRPPAPGGNHWMFPGRTDLRPLTAQALTRQLNRHGIHLRAGRTAALVDLAGQLPPAVLASLLGMHPATAVRWSRRIASDWTAYLRARANAANGELDRSRAG